MSSATPMSSKRGAKPPKNRDLLAARNVFDLARQGLGQLADGLDEAFVAAIDVMANAEGRIVVSGMGKSGHIARKIAATLASTGTPAQVVHPGEASHGDLGMLMAQDVLVAISNSGETAELRDIVAYARFLGTPLIAIVGRDGSALADAADVALVLPKVAEACPLGLAPTTSTTMTLVLGDALAVALMDRKGFSAEEFHVLHPGGRLGRRFVKVEDVMHTGAALPLVRITTPMSDAVLLMTEKCFGCVGIVDEGGCLTGIITDGDLRRHMTDNLFQKTAGHLMTPEPKSIRPKALAAEALGFMNAAKITGLFVTDENRPVGFIHMHDILRSGIA